VPWLNLIGGGRVVLKTVVPLYRDLARTDVKNYIAKTATVVFVSEWNQCFEMLLQVRGIA
jgi:hypothetical protein